MMIDLQIYGSILIVLLTFSFSQAYGNTPKQAPCQCPLDKIAKNIHNNKYRCPFIKASISFKVYSYSTRACLTHSSKSVYLFSEKARSKKVKNTALLRNTLFELGI